MNETPGDMSDPLRCEDSSVKVDLTSGPEVNSPEQGPMRKCTSCSGTDDVSHHCTICFEWFCRVHVTLCSECAQCVCLICRCVCVCSSDAERDSPKSRSRSPTNRDGSHATSTHTKEYVVLRERHVANLFPERILFRLDVNPNEFISLNVGTGTWASFKIGLTHSPTFRMFGALNTSTSSFSSTCIPHNRDWTRMWVIFAGTADEAALLETDLIELFWTNNRIGNDNYNFIYKPFCLS